MRLVKVKNEISFNFSMADEISDNTPKYAKKGSVQSRK